MKKPRRKQNRLSWFPMYVDDFQGGITGMTCTDVGAYVLLLLAQWPSGDDRAVEDAPGVLRAVCRGVKPSPRVLKKFESVEGGLRNERLAGEWEAAREEHSKRSHAGARGAAKLWAGPMAKPSAGPMAKPSAEPVAPGVASPSHNTQPTSHSSPSTAQTSTSPQPTASHRKRAGSLAGAGNDSEPASSTQGCLAYDPAKPWERDLARRCLDLAEKIAAADGRYQMLEEDHRAALEAATATSEGRVARQVRGLPQGWAEVSIAQADAFAAENFG